MIKYNDTPQTQSEALWQNVAGSSHNIFRLGIQASILLDIWVTWSCKSDQTEKIEYSNKIQSFNTCIHGN